MAKISFVLLVVVALIAFQHVAEANRPINNDDKEVLEKDLREAKDLIEEEVKEKEENIKNLQNEVNMLTKSETTLDELGEAYKNGQNIEPYGKKLKKFNRSLKKSPGKKRYGSVIQTILKDLGLNGGY